MLSFHVVPHLHDSLLVFMLFPFGFEEVPHALRWRDSSHSPLQIHIGVRWIISACFQCWLEGRLRNRFPWKSPCWRQVKLQGKNFTVVFAIISMRLGLQFSFCWNNTWWGATGVMYVSHCVIPFGKPHKSDWWVKDYSKVRMCCVVLSIRC